MKLTAKLTPTDELALMNCVVLNSIDSKCLHNAKYVDVKVFGEKTFRFTTFTSQAITAGCIAFNSLQRRWASIEVERTYEVKPVDIPGPSYSLLSVTMEIDLMGKKTADVVVDTSELAKQFSMAHVSHCFTIGQSFAFKVTEKKFNVRMQVVEIEHFAEAGAAKFGISVPNTSFLFQKAPACQIILSGQFISSLQMTSMLNPDFDFNKLGIGGLDEKFKTIFRQVFASRVYPPELIEQMGMRHAKGMLLYGPPGTGKTLMARQICKMLNTRPPKIVNGPEVLNKFVGESEANIRRLFAEAEDEEKKMGIRSALHVIIFDEIDAICKTRGSIAGSTGVQDTVVNQLLSKIDGVEQLNNILIIGMTNRLDMIDEALLRPGRLDIHMEIGLPDKHGRLQILRIHTAHLEQSKRLGADVDMDELAVKTRNFTGAEIEKLVRCATSTAINQIIKFSSKIEIDPKDIKNMSVNRSHFIYALQNDVHATYGASETELKSFIRGGILPWNTGVQQTLESLNTIIRQSASDEPNPLVTVLLEGSVGSGKTTIACQAAIDSGCPFIRVCTAQNMIGFGESSKCQAVKKVFDDAYKSKSSCIILDDIERLLDYAPIGPRFSNLMLQALCLLLRRYPDSGKKTVIIGCTSKKSFLGEVGIRELFSTVVPLKDLTQYTEVLHVLNLLEWSGFSPEDKAVIESNLPNVRSPANGIFVLRQLYVKFNKKQRPLYSVFVDLEKFYVTRSC